MRTTLTLEDDVAAKLKAAASRSGRPFREVVNETLRRGLATRRRPAAAIQGRRARGSKPRCEGPTPLLCSRDLDLAVGNIYN